jgi:hypothetical protein
MYASVNGLVGVICGLHGFPGIKAEVEICTEPKDNGWDHFPRTTVLVNFQIVGYNGMS